MAGFLESLFGGPGDAYDQQRQQLQSTLGQVGNIYGAGQTAGVNALTGGAQQAYGFLGPAFTSAQNYVTGYTPQAIDFLTGYTGQGAGALTGAQAPALAALQSGVNTATGAYAPLTTTAGQYSGLNNAAINAYLGTLGIPGYGPSTFQESPGYKFALQQGLEGINRAANTTGMAAGGNTLAAAGQYAANAANQEFNNYLTNLFKVPSLYAPQAITGLSQAGQGIANAALTGGTGAANIYTGTGSNLANLYGATGRTGAPIYTGAGSTLADLASRLGIAQSGVATGTGGNIANLIGQLTGGQAGQTSTLGQLTAGTYPAEQAASNQTLANLWNLIGAGATAGAKIYAGW